MSVHHTAARPSSGGDGTPRKHDGTDTNRILSALPEEEYERLRPHFEPVDLARGDVVYQPDEPMAFIYFPSGGTISVSVQMADGAEAEVGMIGREGMAGLPVALGTKSAPLKAFTQVPGRGMRVRADLFKEEFDRVGTLHRLILAYAQVFFVQAAVTAACNRLHLLDERLASWLLRSRDRAHSDTLPLTHEFLSVMLGVRRAGVTEAVGRLEAEGLIRHERGRIDLADVAGLEQASCECYRVLRAEFDRLLGAETHVGR